MINNLPLITSYTIIQDPGSVTLRVTDEKQQGKHLSEGEARLLTAWAEGLIAQMQP